MAGLNQAGLRGRSPSDRVRRGAGNDRTSLHVICGARLCLMTTPVDKSTQGSNKMLRLLLRRAQDALGWLQLACT